MLRILPIAFAILPAVDRLPRELSGTINPFRMQVGDYGEFVLELQSGGRGYKISYTIAQIISNEEMYLNASCTGAESVRFKLENVNTDGLVDDEAVQLDGIYKVAGTDRYATVLGASKTVFLLQRVMSGAELKRRIADFRSESKQRKRDAADAEEKEAAKERSRCIPLLKCAIASSKGPRGEAGYVRCQFENPTRTTLRSVRFEILSNGRVIEVFTVSMIKPGRDNFRTVKLDGEVSKMQVRAAFVSPTSQPTTKPTSPHPAR